MGIFHREDAKAAKGLEKREGFLVWAFAMS